MIAPLVYSCFTLVPRLWQELYGSEYPLQNAWFQGPFYYEETGMKNMAKYFDNA
jgi:hypothetical protein